MGEQANGLPVGWEWTGWGRTAPMAGTAYLYPPDKSGADFVGAAYSNGSWSAYASLDDQEPCAEHEADDDAEFTPEALATAQRAVEDALWRVDEYGTGEVRGVVLGIEHRAQFIAALSAERPIPIALPGLPGMWRLTRFSDARPITVDAIRVADEPSDAEPAPVASDDAELLGLLPGLASDVEHVRAIASLQLSGDDRGPVRRLARAAELLRPQYGKLGEAAEHFSDKCERLTARVAELEADLADIHTRYAETMVAFDDAAPDALRALHKRQVDAQGLDATHGAEMAEMVRAALRKKPVAAKGEERGCQAHTGATDGLNCAACIRASTAKGGA